MLSEPQIYTIRLIATRAVILNLIQDLVNHLALPLPRVFLPHCPLPSSRLGVNPPSPKRDIYLRRILSSFGGGVPQGGTEEDF